MTRRTLVVLLIAAVIVSSAATLFANAWIRSPEEAAAETAPPEATPILAPVVEQVLTAEVVTRGTAHYRAPREVSVTPSTLRRGFQVVTSLPRVG
ncbi:MAG TPA: peptidoglycan-binding protein, partial [Actinomycetota bacterium]|nr:peptidoglycan-binding protein [Actinomycetota bacterium]